MKKNNLAIILVLTLVNSFAAEQSPKSIAYEAKKLEQLLTRKRLAGKWIKCSDGALSISNFTISVSKDAKGQLTTTDGSSYSITQLSVGENVVMSLGMEGAEEDGRDIYIFNSKFSNDEFSIDEISYNENSPGNSKTKVRKAICKLGTI